MLTILQKSDSDHASLYSQRSSWYTYCIPHRVSTIQGERPVLAFIRYHVRGDIVITICCTNRSPNHILGFWVSRFGIFSLFFTTFAHNFIAMVLSVLGADTLYPTLTLFTAQSLPSSDQALGGKICHVLHFTCIQLLTSPCRRTCMPTRGTNLASCVFLIGSASG